MPALKVVSFSLVAMTCVFMGGCQSYSVTPRAEQTISHIQTELAMGKEAIKSTAASLKVLRDAKVGELPGAIAQYNNALARLTDRANEVSSVVQTADASATRVFAKWEHEMADAADTDARDSDATRQAEVTGRYNEANGHIVALRGDFLPFMLKLKEVSNTVTANPTIAGRDAVQPAIKDALDQESTVQRDIDALDKAFSRLRGK